MNPTLSIIVPVYDVEKYLVQCVDSILNQPYTDFELILVDDGSPDKCGKICDAYALKDKRIRVIHKENGGLSSARNVAIDIATGKYLSFIDSDDFISEDYYQPNMDYLLSHPQTEMIVMQVCYFDKKTNFIKKNSEREYVNNHDAVGYLLSMNYICSAWINIYKRQVFETIRFPEDKIFEDGFLLPDIADRINNLYLSSRGIYYYRERNDSIMKKKRTEKNWHDILTSHTKILDYCYQYPDNHMRFLKRYKGFSLSLIYAMIEYPNGDFQEYLESFQQYNYGLLQLLRIDASFKEFLRLYIQKKIGFIFMVKVYRFLNIY